MSQEKFEVSKEWLEQYTNNGYSVPSIAEKLSIAGGRKATTATIKALCKHFGIDLRKKPRNYYIPAGVINNIEVDNTLISGSSVDVKSSENVPDTPGGIIENVVLTEDMVQTYPDVFTENKVGDIITVETVTDEKTIEDFIAAK